MRNLKKPLVIILIGLFAVGGIFFAFKFFGKKAPAALQVSSLYKQVEVFLDGELLGETPFYSETQKPKEAVLVLKKDRNVFETKINLTSNTLTVVNRDLGPEKIFSGGEIVWLEESSLGEKLSCVSDPSGAKVRVDGTLLGETPLSAPLEVGEYSLEISKKDYEERKLRVRIQKGYKLNVSAQLFLKPVPESISLLPSDFANFSIYNLSLGNLLLFSDPSSWAKGASYWAKTRGVPLEEEKTFDFFVDFQGQIYDQEGISWSKESKATVEKAIIGYLGKDQGLSEEAKKALSDLSGSLPEPKKQVEILPTGTGWLRVREDPSLGAKEIAKVDVGEKFEVLEEKPGWVKIKLPDGKEGWISSQYTQKLEF